MILITISEYRQRIEDNARLTASGLCPSACPKLNRFMERHGGGRIARLYDVMRYMLAVVDNGAVPFTVIRGAVYFPMARDILISKYGGTSHTWQKYLTEFKAIGLLNVYVPSHHTSGNNTAAMRYSVERAKRSGRRCCYWYNVPAFDESTLTEADRRASALLSASALMHVDTVRDLLGDTIAAKAADSIYSISPATQQQREALYAALEQRLAEQGYLSARDMRDAITAAQDVTGASYTAIEKTLTNYKPKLVQRLGVAYKRPTTDEKQRYGLTNNRYIYRRA